MTALAAALALLSALGRPVAVGNAYHYRPGLFAEVAANRHMPLAWGRVDGFASTPSPAYVDAAHPWVVVVRWPDRTTERLQVVDYSNPRDLAAQRRKGLVVEVDAATASRHHFNAYTTPPGAGHARVLVLGYGRLTP